MNNAKLFEAALNIQKPWSIEKVEFKDKELHMYLNFERGSKFKCSVCGEEVPVHDTSKRTWRHLNFFQYEAYIHARMPRTKCKKDGVKTIDVPWAEPNGRFTLLFEAIIIELAKHMSVAELSRLMGIDEHSSWNIIKKSVKKVKIDMSKVKHIGIDETSYKKGHNYITVIADEETHDVLMVSKGKDSSTMKEFKNKLENPNQIESICMDFGRAYISGAKEHFPKSKLYFDHFHITKILKKALDKVRKTESEEFSKELKKNRFLLLKRKENLKENELEKLNTILETNSNTSKSYKLLEIIDNIWKYKKKSFAGKYFMKWYNLVEQSGIKPLITASKTLKKYIHGFLNAAVSGKNSGFMEGTNSKIKTAFKRACGYKNFDYLEPIILLIGNSQVYNDISSHFKKI